MSLLPDEIFEKIQGLKWLPWIGTNYNNSENKVLIVGESHYAENRPERLAEFDNINMTRECIDDMGVDNNKYNVNFYQNLHFLLTSNRHLNTELFWSKVSFHNFIQKTMTTSSTRPEYIDFHNSSATFFELLDLLKPSYCLMCGVSSFGAVKNNLQNSGFEEVENSAFEMLGGCYPRKLVIKSKANVISNLIFIKHPSHHFSFNDWNWFLEKNAPELLGHFKGV